MSDESNFFDCDMLVGDVELPLKASDSLGSPSIEGSCSCSCVSACGSCQTACYSC